MKKVVQFYWQNGYAVIPSFIPPSVCQRAIHEIKDLISNFSPTQQQITIFDTDKRTHALSRYFLESADKVRFFFEKKAFENGRLVADKINSINKIGHALHEKNKVFAEITNSKSVNELSSELGLVSPQVVQSMAILKPPRIGGPVTMHQDSTYLFQQPETLVGFWIPLQDATVKNGCLWGIPGSHKGPLYRRHKVGKDLVPRDEICVPQDFDSNKAIPLEMKAGDLAIFTGRFLHKSNENLSDQSRYAYTWHVKDGRSKWSEENWLQRDGFKAL